MKKLDTAIPICYDVLNQALGKAYNMRGTHHRNFVYANVGHAHGHVHEVELEHETKSETYGWFSVFHSYYSSKYFVLWRATRNHQKEYTTFVMHDGVDQRPVYSWERDYLAYDSMADALNSISMWERIFEFPKPKRRRLRDSQKSKFYTWEHMMIKDLGPTEEVEIHKWPNGDTTVAEHAIASRKRSEKYLNLALDHICINMYVDRPPLKFRTGGSMSTGGLRDGIKLLPCHKNLHILIHELAHVLTRTWFGRRGIQGHGQEYAGVFAYLMIRFCDIDKAALISHAAKAKVKLVLPEQYWEWEQERNTHKVQAAA